MQNLDSRSDSEPSSWPRQLARASVAIRARMEAREKRRTAVSRARHRARTFVTDGIPERVRFLAANGETGAQARETSRALRQAAFTNLCAQHFSIAFGQWRNQTRPRSLSAFARVPSPFLRPVLLSFPSANDFPRGARKSFFTQFLRLGCGSSLRVVRDKEGHDSRREFIKKFINNVLASGRG